MSGRLVWLSKIRRRMDAMKMKSNGSVSVEVRAKHARTNDKMTQKEYEKELNKLQVDLCHLQEWVKAKGLKVIVVFEGRDAAGKGGTIKAITERVSPRVFRVAALPAPSDREENPLYVPRSLSPFPAPRGG